jgi:phosphocarrier protein
MKARGTSSPVRREFSIINKRGLHARASARFVETVNGFEAEVRVRKDGIEVDGGSILDLMMLAASPGCTITVEAVGPEAAQVIEALEGLVADRFGEEG